MQFGQPPSVSINHHLDLVNHHRFDQPHVDLVNHHLDLANHHLVRSTTIWRVPLQVMRTAWVLARGRRGNTSTT
ncbi:hypothetical protein E2C01_028368 [Portunus trituberculatus]|uniref:Uncharacterized protein n=1 Tax=Portunus trituberculatus TaxID=210409 RepID=A0A5B7EPU4_PORTR|nr:hypothetical protein [Portunus trituberculatus]